MKLNIFLIFVLWLALFSVAANASTVPTDRDLDGFVGPVKRVDEDVAEMKMRGGKRVESSRHRSRMIVYDRQGRMTRRLFVLYDSSTTEQIFSYEKNYRLMQSLMQRPFTAPGRTSALPGEALMILRFDAAENALYEDIYMGHEPSPGALTQKYRHRFDADGRLIETILYTSKGVEAIKSVYVYGTERHPSERRIYAAGSSQGQVIRYTYTLDSRGNWIKRIEENSLTNKDGSPRIEITYREILYY
jgi:hypothetical protein